MCGAGSVNPTASRFRPPGRHIPHPSSLPQRPGPSRAGDIPRFARLSGRSFSCAVSRRAALRPRALCLNGVPPRRLRHDRPEIPSLPRGGEGWRRRRRQPFAVAAMQPQFLKPAIACRWQPAGAAPVSRTARLPPCSSHRSHNASKRGRRQSDLRTSTHQTPLPSVAVRSIQQVTSQLVRRWNSAIASPRRYSLLRGALPFTWPQSRLHGVEAPPSIQRRTVYHNTIVGFNPPVEQFTATVGYVVSLAHDGRMPTARRRRPIPLSRRWPS